MYTLSVSAANSSGDGLGPQLTLQPETVHTLIDLDVNISGLTGSVPGPLASLADALSSVAPSLLHVTFSDGDMRGAVTVISKGALGPMHLNDHTHISLWDLTHP